MRSLHNFIKIRGRYSRATNVERDFASASALAGYVPTPRALETLNRLLASFTGHFTQRAWTISGSYGTGKSSLALFLAAIFGPQNAPASVLAAKILDERKKLLGNARDMVKQLPPEGLVLAFAVGQRAPLAHVITSALERGIASFWQHGSLPAAAVKVKQHTETIAAGGTVSPQDVLVSLRAVAADAQTGILLVIDEFGKVLEYAASQRTEDDLFLLQQITELPSGPDDPPILTLLLLHQSFADYASPLQAKERAEWGKIQGRFEDIPYAEGPTQMLRLMCQAIVHDRGAGCETCNDQVSAWAAQWHSEIEGQEGLRLPLDEKTIEALYPLHPITALVLPAICTKYAQNDRSLFSFLTSAESHGFQWFLGMTPWSDNPLPVMKVHHLYDYFVETARLANVTRPEFQRWTEIEARVAECANQPAELVEIVKTVGLFNLVAMTGTLRASRELILLALADNPASKSDWARLLETALERKILTWRRQADELRIWEGSDFDVEVALEAVRPAVTEPLSLLLQQLAPLPPIVARRHSYESGTLRFFERWYAEDMLSLSKLVPSNPSSDGLLVHWLGGALSVPSVPDTIADGRPVIVLNARGVDRLDAAAREVVALERLEATAPQLQTDGIARREIRQRLLFAKAILDAELRRNCNLEDGPGVAFTPAGPQPVRSWRDLNALLSMRCDEIYHKGARLWTELLNRRELTTQGAKARRELIEAMIRHHGDPNLGLIGYGPEVSMAKSALERTGLYGEREAGTWGFGRPNQDMLGVYEAVDTFIRTTTDRPQCVKTLFENLGRPPCGMKAGPMPVLLAAYLIERRDEVGLYHNGTFQLSIGTEHFDLLMKQPQEFTLKSFNIVGARRTFCDALAEALGINSNDGPISLVALVKRLLGRSKHWPEYTRKTLRHLPSTAIALRDVFLNAREPDILLFESIPQALERPPFTGQADEPIAVRQLATGVVDALKQLDNAYGLLLKRAQRSLAENFSFPASIEEQREMFVRRGLPILKHLDRSSNSPTHVDASLRRFLIAATDATGSNRDWLEAALMVALDRPVTAWTDSDETSLEYRLSDLARRFRNIEAFRAEFGDVSAVGYARRISLTQPNGEELARMVSIDNHQRTTVEGLVERTLSERELFQNPELREAFVVTLFERIFGHSKVIRQSEGRNDG